MKKKLKKTKPKPVAPKPVAPKPVAPRVVSVIDVPLDQIDMNPAQPTFRQEGSTLTALINNIALTGYIAPITCARQPNGRYVHIDGWRRYLVAKHLRHTTIKVVDVGDVPVTEWFILLNSATKVFNGRTWLALWKNSKNRAREMQMFPAATRNRINALIEDMGSETAFEKVVDGINSPNLWNFIHHLLPFLVEFKKYAKTDAQKAIAQKAIDAKQLIEWIVRNPASLSPIKHTLHGRDLTHEQRRRAALRMMEACAHDWVYTPPPPAESRRVQSLVRDGAAMAVASIQ